MYKALLLFFMPSRLADLAVSQGQSREAAIKSLNEIRPGNFNAIFTILLLSIILIGCAYITNQLILESPVCLVYLCFKSSAFIAIAGLARLSWEIQTYKVVTIPE